MNFLHSSFANLDDVDNVNSSQLLEYTREIAGKINECIINHNQLGFLHATTYNKNVLHDTIKRVNHNFKVLLQRAILLEIDNEEIDKSFRFIQNYLKNLDTLLASEHITFEMKAFSENRGNLEDNEIILGGEEEVMEGEETEEKYSKFQMAYMYCLDKLKEYKWRSLNENVCQLVYVCLVQDVNGDFYWVRENKINSSVHTIVSRYSAYHWEKVCRIDDVVSHKLVDWEEDAESWKKLTEKGCTTDEVVKNLKRFVHDSRFPAIQLCHRSRSFLNGILFFLRSGVKFYKYSQHEEIRKEFANLGVYDYGSSPLLIEKYFDESVLFYADPMDIPTPCFHSILSHQQFKRKTSSIIYALLGRALVPLRTFDKWQIIPFIKGVANSGKSTVGNVLSKCFSVEDVGIVSSNIEEKFGLEPIADKQVWLCYEVTKKFGIDRSEFQSMISGESMSIKKKNRKAESVQWNPSGWMFGNEFMVFNDSSGSVSRRIVVIIFGETAVDTDTDLERKIMMELPFFIVKIYQSYIRLLNNHGHSSFWDFCPRYFIKTKRYLEGVTNPCKAYLRSNNFIRGMDKYMLVRDFQQMFKSEYGIKIDKEELKSACISERKYCVYQNKTKKLNMQTGKREVNAWLNGIAPSTDNTLKKYYSDDDILDEEEDEEEEN